MVSWVVSTDNLVLQLIKQLEPGDYNIAVRLTDGKDLSQMTTVKARVCDCEGTDKSCEKRAHIAGGMGVPAILGILGGILGFLSK